MSEPTDVTVPQWAALVLDHLASAHGLGCALEGEDPRLTDAERDALDGLWILLRARFGKTKLDEPEKVAAGLLRRAVRLLDEQGQQ